MSVVQQLLTVPQVAALLGMSAKTIEHWAQGRSGPHGFPGPVHVGRQVRYLGMDINAWIESLRTSAVKAARTDLPVVRRRGRPRKIVVGELPTRRDVA